MGAKRLVRYLMVPAVVLSLALSSAAHAPAALPTPKAEVQGQGFSVTSGGPLTVSGVHPADILGIGGLPLIPCEHLGLVCTDPASGAQDDVRALSYGWDFGGILPPLQFAVGAGSKGAPGTAVTAEAGCLPPEPQADVFETAFHGVNWQDLDGDGAACAGNAGYGLLLTEGASSDEVDGLSRDPCQFVDLDCDGWPENPVYLVLSPGSPTLDLIGARASDILVAGVEYAPLVWAEGTTDLGLDPGDAIDALCLRENGSGTFDVQDQVLFSLAPGSPTLGLLGASPSDLLVPGGPRVAVGASSLGLMAADNVAGLVCSSALVGKRIYLPVVMRRYG
jgi:hypothetical protein